MAGLEKAAAAPGFWDDPKKAQEDMRRIAEAKRLVERWRGLAGRLDDAGELVSLGEEEVDSRLSREIESEVAGIAAALEEMELELAFSSSYDKRNAMLGIHAG
ncbi:MAG: PCRF domain-containing protein, partial [Dehalococcoidales bacterium]